MIQIQIPNVYEIKKKFKKTNKQNKVKLLLKKKKKLIGIS